VAKVATEAGGYQQEEGCENQAIDHSEDFRKAFAILLPRLRANDISQGKAARRLGISVWSLKRYLSRAACESS